MLTAPEAQSPYCLMPQSAALILQTTAHAKPESRPHSSCGLDLHMMSPLKFDSDLSPVPSPRWAPGLVDLCPIPLPCVPQDPRESGTSGEGPPSGGVAPPRSRAHTPFMQTIRSLKFWDKGARTEQGTGDRC